MEQLFQGIITKYPKLTYIDKLYFFCSEFVTNMEQLYQGIKINKHLLISYTFSVLNL
jgi:hypothetical protein